MGPTKAIIKDQALYEAATGKCIKDGFASRRDIEDYVNHHYLALGRQTHLLFPRQSVRNTRRPTCASGPLS